MVVIDQFTGHQIEDRGIAREITPNQISAICAPACTTELTEVAGDHEQAMIRFAKPLEPPVLHHDLSRASRRSLFNSCPKAGPELQPESRS